MRAEPHDREVPLPEQDFSDLANAPRFPWRHHGPDLAPRSGRPQMREEDVQSVDVSLECVQRAGDFCAACGREVAVLGVFEEGGARGDEVCLGGERVVEEAGFEGAVGGEGCGGGVEGVWRMGSWSMRMGRRERGERVRRWARRRTRVVRLGERRCGILDEVVLGTSDV